LVGESYGLASYPRLYGVRTSSFEELWRVEGPGKLSRVFRRKRR